MIKKSIFTLAMMAVMGWASAQSLQFELNGEVLSDGQTVYYADFNEDFGEFILEMQLHNISGTDLNVVVEKEEISVPEGSMNYFCWGLCFAPTTYVSPAVPMAAGSVSGEGDLAFHFMPGSMTDVGYMRYYAYEEGSHERVSVNVVFNSLESVGEMPSCTFSHAYPNPASSVVRFNYELSSGANATACIYNLLGQEVMRQELSDLSGQLTLSVADLNEGIYFCNLMVNGRTLKTEKFIVKK